MDVAGFNLIDLIVIAVILLSGICALARGFVKEVLSIVSWVGAVFVTLYGFNTANAFVLRFIESPMIAMAVAGGVLFLVTLFTLSFVSSFVANRVRGSTVSSVDRSLGFVFGLLRGFVLISIAYLALSWALPPAEQPKWVRAAKTMPLMEKGAAWLTLFGPASMRDDTLAQPLRPTQDSSAWKPLTPDSGPGYKMDERKEMDRLIQGTQ